MNAPDHTTDDSLLRWRREPMAAFESLLRSPDFNHTNRSSRQLPTDHRVRDNSARVYKAMYGKYLSLLQQLSVEVPDASTREVGLFMLGELRDVTRETALRYLRLLERVYDHLVFAKWVASNPITEWVRAQRATGELGNWKSVGAPSQVERKVVELLQDWLFTRGQDALAAGDWRTARDISLGSLSLGTGMRSSELLKLQRQQVRRWPRSAKNQRFEFHIPGSASAATVREHNAKANEQCVALFEAWWSARWTGFDVGVDGRKGSRTVVIPGEVVFPSSLKGSQLDPSTLHKNLSRLADEAINDEVLSDDSSWMLTRGAQGLRRAYTLTELEVGAAEDTLQNQLGMWERRSVRRYEEQLTKDQKSSRKLASETS